MPDCADPAAFELAGATDVLLSLPPQPATNAVTRTAIVGPIIVDGILEVFMSALPSIQQSIGLEKSDAPSVVRMLVIGRLEVGAL